MVNPGVLIGTGFGLVFLLVNSAAPLPAAVGFAVKGVGGLAVLAVLWAQWHPCRVETREVAVYRPDMGRPFRLVVAAEVVIGGAGLAGLRLGGAPWQANVAWIAAIVGAHFLALAVVWRDLGIAAVGAVMMTAGLAGLALAATSTAVAWIPAISGLTSGFALLLSSLAVSAWPRRGVGVHRGEVIDPAMSARSDEPSEADSADHAAPA